MTGNTQQSLATALASLLANKLDGFISLDSLERLTGGASQETYRLEVTTRDGARTLALRRAAGGQSIARDGLQIGIAQEARLWRIARSAGVPAPEVLAEFTQTEGIGEGILMPWLEGEALGHRIVKDAHLATLDPSLAFQCGQTLARIHRIDITLSGLRERLAHVTARELVDETWSRYRSYGTPQPMIDYTARWLRAHLPRDRAPRLVHGDFRNGNLLIGRQGIVAVLDWEIAYIGDPMRDLGWLCTRSWRFGRHDKPVGGFGEYEDLFAGYRDESGEEVDREALHFWEVFGSFWWAVGCLAMADQYRQGPDRQVERPAIGRRSTECQIDCVNLLIPGDTKPLPPPVERDSNLPTTLELLRSVRDFLRQDVARETSDRLQYLSRVAANSLEIVERSLQFAPLVEAEELVRLRALLSRDDDLSALRNALIEHILDGKFKLDDPALTTHLRATVSAQLAIDQPGYAGNENRGQTQGVNR